MPKNMMLKATTFLKGKRKKKIVKLRVTLGSVLFLTYFI